MVRSNYKFSSELAAKSGKYAYKLRSKKKDLFVNIFVPIGIIIMLSILIYDLVKGNNPAIDIVLLVLLCVLEGLNIFMPKIIYNSQKKYAKKLEDQNYDTFISEYNKGVFKEKIYNNNKMVYCNEVSIDRLANFVEFEHYFLFIFNNYASVIFDLENLEEGTREDLLKLASSSLANKTKK
ncbi:MAG: hypothetical protein IJX26_01545 [Clostridia bacterium]|nr:hypothetical protein [Clostridia bacterium]